MSGYLEEPCTEKEVLDGVSKSLGLRYGSSCMQGWRISNEDAVSCEPTLTPESALFAVYDGHGGAEVSKYVAKYLPNMIISQAHFKEGRMEDALREAFLALDTQIISEEAVDELQELAGTKADDEDEEDMEDRLEECEALNEEASMPMVDLIAKYKQKFAELAEEEEGLADEDIEMFEGLGKGKKKKRKAKKSEEEEAGKEEEEEAGKEEGAAAVSAENGEKKVEKKENGEKIAEKKENGDVAAAAAEGGSANGDAAGTSNGEATAADDEDDEEDADYSEEEEGDSSGEGDSDEDDDDEEGSSEEESEDDTPPMDYDEREGYGSGTTACVAVLREGVISVANVGDSRCVVCTGGSTKDLSVDHKPESDLERTRIEKAGGTVSKDGRVNGGLNLARALGDHQYKANQDIKPEEQMISPMPDIVHHTIDKKDEFMIVACDGIWNALSSEEAVAFVKQHLEEAKQGGTTISLSGISSKLMEKCLAPDTEGDGTGCDNMTCIIVLLNQDVALEEHQQKRKHENSENSEITEQENKSKKSKKSKAS